MLCADDDTGEVHTGLIDLVCDMLENPNAPEPNTLEETQEWGEDDPVPYHFENSRDGVSIKDCAAFWAIIKDIDITDDDIDSWFGQGRNHIRDRAIMLVENGHVDPTTMRVLRATKKQKQGDETDTVYLLEAKVIASQKTQYYWTRVCLDSWMQSMLGRPYSSCECVVRRGPACSHQLAVLLTFMATRIVMFRLQNIKPFESRERPWEILKGHLPLCMLIMQKVPMTVRYAYGHGSMQRFSGVSTGHMACLLKLHDNVDGADAATRVAPTPTLAASVAPPTPTAPTDSTSDAPPAPTEPTDATSDAPPHADRAD